MDFGILQHHYQVNSNILGWYWSRKYNGESVLWDGSVTRGKEVKDLPWSLGEQEISSGLWSLGRANKPKVIHATEDFLNGLPLDIPLHGEIWCSNDSRDIPSSICKTKIASPLKWGLVKFLPFNIKPYYLWGLKKSTLSLKGQKFHYDTNFETKIEILSSLANSIIEPIMYHKIKSHTDITEVLTLAKNSIWEGLCFNNPYSMYELKRSYNVLKWKPIYETEVKIIGWEDGKTGKNIGSIGAITCELVWDDKILSIFGGKHAKNCIGKRLVFNVCGLNEIERSNVKAIYPIGQELRISFNGVTSYGVPLHANIYRENLCNQKL